MTVRQEIDRLELTKEEIRTAIVNKGQTLATTAPICPDYPNKIALIQNTGTGVTHNTLKEVIEGTAEIVQDSSLVYIRPYCFSGCDNLTTAVFTTLQKIEQHAFDGCYLFKHLVLNRNEMTYLVNINAFKDTPLMSFKGGIYVPEALQTVYRADKMWSYYHLNIKSIACFNMDIKSYLEDKMAANRLPNRYNNLGYSTTTTITSTTNMANANMDNCNICNANLTGANLSGANLENCDLFGANLTNTTCIANQNLSNLYYGRDFIVEDNTIVYL